VSYAGKTALLDTKTIEGHTFPHSLIVDHQVAELLQHEAAGALGGYVIWLRTLNQVIFARASSLEKLAGVAGSIGAEDCQLLGAIETFNPREIFIPSQNAVSPPGRAQNNLTSQRIRNAQKPNGG